MLSGFSPSLLKLVMRDQLGRPEDALLETLNDPHFERLSLRPRRRPQSEPGSSADAAAAAAGPAGEADAAAGEQHTTGPACGEGERSNS